MQEHGDLRSPDEDGLPGCGEVGWPSFLIFGWINPVVSVGVQRQISVEDTPRLAEAEDTLRNARQLLQRLEAAERAESRHPLLRSMALCFWPELLFYEVFSVASFFLELLEPLMLQRVLVFQEAQEEGIPGAGAASQGYAAVAGLIALHLFQAFYSAHLSFYEARIRLRIGSALMGAVLVRGVQGTAVPGSSGAAVPAVYNVLSFDIEPNTDIIFVVLGLWIFPIQFASAVGVLCHQVKGAAVPGVIAIFLCKIIVGVFMFCDGIFRHQLFQWKDVRLGRCNEGFNNVRTLQMLSWVGPFQERIMEARVEELRYRARRLWMTKMGAALDYSLQTIATLATFWYFTVHRQGELKASLALPVINLIKPLIGPFGKFPPWLNQYLVWRSAYVRTNNFLSVGSSRPRALADVGEPAAEGTVAAFQECTLSWGGSSNGAEQRGQEHEADEEQVPLLETEAAFALRGLDLSVKGGEMLVLLGLAGEGKSSVLQGLLGEMVLEAGSVNSPAISRRAAAATEGQQLPATTAGARQLLADAQEAGSAGRFAVAYAAQEVLLLTGTVRKNVLFGARWEEDIYAETLASCALEVDLAALPAGDLTEVAQGGANLSGGQKARIGLARAAYRAAVLQRSGTASLVLLDDPLCALDRRVAREVCQRLFAPATGLLTRCAVVLAAADPWFLSCLLPASAGAPGRLRAAVLRGGRAVALGNAADLCQQELPELRGAQLAEDAGDEDMPSANPQDALESAPEPEQPPPTGAAASDASEPAPNDNKKAKTAASPGDEGADGQAEEPSKDAGQVVKDEGRVEGRVKCATYLTYLESVGPFMLLVIAISLAGISLFQNFCNLWIVYWTSENREQTKFHKWLSKFTDHPPTAPDELLVIYGIFVACFTLSNFAGHSFEILGGVSAARSIFNSALRGSLARPFRWWDANPTGRVLNRFSEDVEVMDAAITNILGVIFGAVLYFVSHSIVLAIANPLSLLLLPVVIIVLEYYARFYRQTVREVQRIFLVSMGKVYQEIVEAILGKVTVRAYDATHQVLCSGLSCLDTYQRNSFTKTCVMKWVTLRMTLIGYVLGLYNTLQPVLQYWGLLHKQSAALVGFSINYSKEIMAIVQQLIMNYSDLEMQLVSIERLQEYAESEAQSRPPALLAATAQGLQMHNVEVCYHVGLRPALSGVSLRFPPCQVAAIVGRTGAGKSSLLLSVLQLVPYTGRIEIGGRTLAQLDPEDVRRRLVGVVPQHPVIFAGDLRWNLDPEGVCSDEQLAQVLQAVGLQAAGEGGLARECGGASGGVALSAGQRQLLCAARALLRRPRVALLDEVTASLPRELAGSTASTLIGRFKEQNAVVLLVTHQEELLPHCDRVVTVASGRVVSDTAGVQLSI